MKLSDLSLDKRLEALLTQSAINELYPPQEEAIRAGLLDSERNFIIATPTASGKTFLAELAMLQAILTGSGKCLYVVPLNALAYEKYQNFKERYGAAVKVGISTGDYESSSRYLERNEITILTLEKLDSLTRLKPAWLRSISVVVVDEVHVLGEDKRGPRLEGAMARFMSFNPAARVIGLSATIANVAEFGGWLDARVVQSDWRPVPLKEEILLAKSDREIIERVDSEVARGAQVLVFVNTKRGAASFARKVAAEVRLRTDALDTLAEKVDIGVDDLPEIARSGVAYHNSWLHPEQRRAIEDSFRARDLKVICCTPTLAMGVSLPAKLVLIRNYKFYTLGRGLEPMPVFWVKQVFGRAGRPEHDAYGTGVIVARDEESVEEIQSVYIDGALERIESRFSLETMTEQILATIVGGAQRIEQVLEFLNSTFYAFQHSTELEALLTDLDSILLELSRKGFIELDSDRLRPTPFGALASRLYLSVHSALELREGIQTLGESDRAGTLSLSDFDLLILLCRCDEIIPLTVKHAFEIATNLSENLEWVYYAGHALGSAIVAQAWIEEHTYAELKETFNAYPGEIHNTIFNLGWMAYAASRIADYLKEDHLSARLRLLHDRIKHGVKSELLGLVAIKGVGRVIARGLYARGLRTPHEVATADLRQLEQAPGVGAKRAVKLKEEALEQCMS
ncbi:MAG: DEAD/DEAH box helicase [Candidatus Methanospirareceae archaeon]